MDTLEYAKAKRRICRSHCTCRDCPLGSFGEGCSVGAEWGTEEEDKTNIETVEQWAKAHPLKTRQDEFLKMHPNAEIHEAYGTLKLCPRMLEGNIFACAEITCEKCLKEYWRKEIE